MPDIQQFVKVKFQRFKAFDSFTLNLRQFNILVGPNNAGKSTIIAAFRILAAAMRKANAKSAERVTGPRGHAFGYVIDLKLISIAEENLFYNYEDSEPATVTFTLSNKNELQLYFPAQGACYLIPDAHGKRIQTPSNFRSHFNCPIGFVPILGPVEHNEELHDKEAARLALFNNRAARNFRNIWYHYPEKFDSFHALLAQSWPGMDIERPKIDLINGKAVLHMFCHEDRIPREIFWAGFGFQVWCQMLTHLIQSDEKSLFLVDEPDIYLHSDLQRQLLGLLRNMGPDILIATHSTELITEAETDDIVLVNKKHKVARRIRNPSQLEEVFRILGSSMNPVLTQLAKTRRVVFVEGDDFQILGKFARKLGYLGVGNRSDFAVVPVRGFNPDRIRSLTLGMETTLGAKISVAAVLDKDYRGDAECESIAKACEDFCAYIRIHRRKEIENFLLVPAAIDRAIEKRIEERSSRTGVKIEYEFSAKDFLKRFVFDKKNFVRAQYSKQRKQFSREESSRIDDAEITEAVLRELDAVWDNDVASLAVIPGKEAFAAINGHLQDQFGISLTPTAVIDAMRTDEVPDEMSLLISDIASFCLKRAVA